MGHVFAKTKGGSMAESVNIKNVEDTLNDFCISYKSRYCGKKLHRCNNVVADWEITLSKYNTSVQFNYHTILSVSTVEDGNMFPCVKDVIRSLSLENSRALSISFKSWCKKFGLDNKSARSHKIYSDCRKNAKKLRKLFFDKHFLIELAETV